MKNPMIAGPFACHPHQNGGFFRAPITVQKGRLLARSQNAALRFQNKAFRQMLRPVYAFFRFNEGVSRSNTFFARTSPLMVRNSSNHHFHKQVSWQSGVLISNSPRRFLMMSLYLWIVGRGLELMALSIPFSIIMEGNSSTGLSQGSLVKASCYSIGNNANGDKLTIRTPTKWDGLMISHQLR